jgi:uncharacterized protein (DUF2235 family)
LAFRIVWESGRRAYIGKPSRRALENLLRCIHWPGPERFDEAFMKRIVVCLDGTWNSDDTQTTDTNVSQIARAIHGSQETGGILQIVLYLRGVGTTGLKMDTLYQGAVGLGVDDNIRSAYQFIAQNYVPGDEIYLFGFSRGSFTARSLAGLITACSILKRQSLGSLPDAWAYYRSPKPHSPDAFAKQYKVDVHEGVTIKFVGVWDTVGSLGIPGGLWGFDKSKFAFHDTSPSRIVLNAFHAMAVDEHRRDFTPTYWTGTPPQGTNIIQVWFTGAHSDVGGGYVTRQLADIPLVWMAQQAEKIGLALDWACLPDHQTLAPTAPSHDSSSGFFALDGYRPTYRVIGGKAFSTAFNEVLYTAVDENNHPVQTINERVHRSVVNRYGKPAQACSDDDKGVCAIAPYSPKNLAQLFPQNVFAGLPIEE